MKTYLISGGAGFLGSHLTDRLLGQGHRVIVVDNLITGLEKNLEGAHKNPNFTFILQDIIEPLSIDEPIDYVCNLACPASPPAYFSIPLETLETNSIGTKNLLELAKLKGARFFHTSTSEVYGDPEVHPQHESYAGSVQPYCQRSCYDEGKRYAEALIYVYHYTSGVNTGIIRIFNTYGPRMRPDDGRVVSTFISQALAGQDLPLTGTGNQTRSFCYVDDQIDAMVKFINSDHEGPINIGNPGEFTMAELADMILKMTGSSSKIVKVAEAPSDPKRRRPDITKARELINWQPKVELKEGLEKTISWFKTL